MVVRKDGSTQNLEGIIRDHSEKSRVNDEGNPDTLETSHNTEEGDEDYDDEELDNDELTEEDFDIDGDEEDNEDETA